MIFAVLGLFVLAYFWIVLGYFTACNFGKNPYYSYYNAGFFFGTNNNLIFLRILLAYLVGYFYRIIYVGIPQRRVQQRTEEDVTAFRAKIKNRTVIPERNVV